VRSSNAPRPGEPPGSPEPPPTVRYADRPLRSRRRIRPLHIALAGVALLGIVFLVLWTVHSNNFLLLPDKAHPVAPLVRVQGGSDPKGPGGIYFVDVVQQRATLLETLFPWLHDGADLVPARDVVPPGMTIEALRRAGLRQMQLSQSDAAAVALRELGYKVVVRPSGVLVEQAVPNTGAVGKLQATDVIVSLDGRRVRTLAQLHAALARHRPGDVVRVGLRRGDRLTTAEVKATRTPRRPRFAFLGVYVKQATDVRLPIRVQIQAGNVGGPSAGLPFALEVMEELGRDVDRGYRVVATGELGVDGTVGPIGGVKQKTFGARLARADVFLVPAGENFRTARRYAHGLRVVSVHSFQQALHALATLPPKA
jgi:PDZ domain-containing protein